MKFFCVTYSCLNLANLYFLIHLYLLFIDAIRDYFAGIFFNLMCHEILIIMITKKGMWCMNTKIRKICELV